MGIFTYNRLFTFVFVPYWNAMWQHADCTIMNQIQNRENANLSWNAPTLGLQGE